MSTITDKGQRLMTRSQAARELGISAERVSQLRRTGRIPAMSTPLGFLFDRVDVEKARLEREARRQE